MEVARRMDSRRLIPSMFHRRLVLLGAAMLVVLLVLTGQLVRLSVVEGAERAERAHRALERRTFLPTYRGSILDRNGRALAHDVPGYALAIEYEVISDRWVYEQAREQAIEALGRSRWITMHESARQAAIDQLRPVHRRTVEALYDDICRLAGIERAELDERLDAIREDVHHIAAAVWDRQRQALISQYGEEGAPAFSKMPVREQVEAHTVLADLDDETAFAFRALAEQYPGMIEVRDDRRRAYPWLTQEVTIDRSSLPRMLRSNKPLTIEVRGVADHIIGSMRSVQREDVEARPFRDHAAGTIDLGGYRPTGDRAGSRGLEGTFEYVLRGELGQITRRVDTKDEDRIPFTPGEDVRTTLDIALQARIQAILRPELGLTVVQPYQHSLLPPGWPLNAAAVVLDITTGEVIAMVSSPTLAEGFEMSEEWREASYVYMNRPVEAVYPPGSIIKPLVLVSAVEEGVYDVSEEIDCKGHYFPNNKSVARDWIYREKYGWASHGVLGPADAIAKSSNYFFYTLADRMGMERLLAWYERFGLSRRLDIGLGRRVSDRDGGTILIGESAGTLPTEEQIDELRTSGALRFETISLGIGQGKATWTPLHAANAYAILARHGAVRGPRLVLNENADGSREAPLEDLPLDADAVQAALEGLRRSVNETYGTGQHITYDDGRREPIFNAPGVTVWGKTGTAQAPPLRPRDTNGDGEINLDDQAIRDLDHAWFVGLVGPNDTKEPMFAIAVIVEYGGSGGRVAGPVANQIIRALQREGYLPGDELEALPGARPGAGGGRP